MRARARLNEHLDPRVVVGEHGWWQACPELRAPGYDPFGPLGANFNLLIGTTGGPGQRHSIAPLLSLRDPAGRDCLMRDWADQLLRFGSSKIKSNVALGLAAADQQIAIGRRLDWIWPVDHGAGN